MKKLHWSIMKRLYRLAGRHAVYHRLNRSWLLDNRNWIDQQLIVRRPYETEQLAFCRKQIRDHQLGSFFDIGANFGLYSVMLADESTLTSMHAFEPLPRNIHQLSANLYLNGLDARVQLHNFALSNENGTLELHVDPQSTGVSTLLPDELHRGQQAYQYRIQVETKTFDELFADTQVRAFIKMDVEGAECMVLDGMRQFLDRNKAILQIETTPQTLEQVNAFMVQHGYSQIGCIGADSYYGNV